METTGKSLKTNLLINALRIVASLLFPLITLPYVARVLGVEALGKVNFIYSIVTVFIITSSLGIPTYGVRELAKVRDDKDALSQLFNELFTLGIIATVLSAAVYLVMLLIFPRLQSDPMLFLISGLNLVFNVFGVQWLYQATEDYLFITARAVFVQAISLVLLFIFVRHTSDYNIYAMIMAIGTTGCNVFNIFYARRYVNIRLTTAPKSLLRHIKPVFVFFITILVIQIYSVITTILLGFVRDDEAVGYFVASQKANSVILGFITSISTVLLPRVSFYIKNQMWKEINDILSKTIKLIIFLSLPVSVFLYAMSSEIIIVLFGSGFSKAIILSKILSPKIVLISLSTVTAIQILIPAGKEKQFLISCFYGCIISVISSAILMPSLGEIGAAIANLTAEIVVVVSLTYRARDLVLKHIFHLSNLSYLFAALAPLPLIYIIQNCITIPILSLLTCSFVFTVTYYLILMVLKDSIAILILDYVIGILRKLTLSKFC